MADFASLGPVAYVFTDFHRLDQLLHLGTCSVGKETLTALDGRPLALLLVAVGDDRRDGAAGVRLRRHGAGGSHSYKRFGKVVVLFQWLSEGRWRSDVRERSQGRAEHYLKYFGRAGSTSSLADIFPNRSGSSAAGCSRSTRQLAASQRH